MYGASGLTGNNVDATRRRTRSAEIVYYTVISLTLATRPTDRPSVVDATAADRDAAR